MSITFTLNGSTTLDETSGLQNGTATPTPAGDANDNDVSLETLPEDFFDRLFGSMADGGLALDPEFSGEVGVAESASNFIEIDASGSVSNLSWTGAGGAPLPVGGPSSGWVESGLIALDGGSIYLFADPTDDNIVLGKTADGTVVFAAYIDEQETNGEITGAKVWMVTLEPIAHGTTTDPDDADVFLGGKLFITASEDITFDLSTLDSGQFKWNAFGNDDVQIIVSPDASTQTVNTSKGGGSTTIGNSNQMLDGVNPSKDPNGEAMVLTFVKDTPEILTQGSVEGYDYGNLGTVSYDALQNATGGEWTISQTQGSPSSSVTATMKAYSAEVAGGGVESGAPDLANDDPAPITSITLKGPGTISGATLGTDGFYTFTAPATPTDGIDFTGTRTVGTGQKAKTYEFTVDFKADGTVEIKGLLAKDAIAYETSELHNRLILQNTGQDDVSADWDIGGFKLFDTGQESVDVGPDMRIEDDGPVASPIDLGIVHEDALGTGDLSTGNGEATTPAQTKTANGDLNDAFSSGTDAPAEFVLAVPASGLPALTSKGVAVTYAVVGGTLTATAGGRTVFTWTVNANGTWTFDLNDQLDHTAGAGDGGLLTINLTPFLTVTDAEGDPAVLAANSVTIRVENDVPRDTVAVVSATVHEDALGTGDLSTGNGETTTPAQTKVAQGSVAALVAVGADEDAVWSLSANTSGLPALTSKGVALVYTVQGNVLTATAGVGGTTVFTLTLAANGDYTFDLNDQIDHAPAAGDSAFRSIDLSSVLVARDFDTDSATPDAGSFVIRMENDVPEIGPIADGAVDFVAGDHVTRTLNGAIGGDDRVAGATTYTFASFDDVTDILPGLTGQIVEGGTKVVFFTDGSGGQTGVYDTGDTLFFDAALNQTTGNYTFTVHRSPPPAEVSFDLSTLDSGQFKWNAFGNDDVQIIVSPDASTQTVNTSKGGGSTTIGNSNQMLDGVNPSKDPNGEAMVLTFVKDTPEILTQGSVEGYDYGNLGTVSYDALQNATGGEWTISQTQGSPSSSVTATMKAYSAEVAGGGVESGAPDLANDDPAPITSITLKGPGTISGATLGTDGFYTFTAPATPTDGIDFTGTRTVGTGQKAKTYEFTVDFKADGTVEIKGLLAKDAVKYTTEEDHNRLILQNTGQDDVSADWDIGGFKLVQSQPTPDQEFDFVVDITDHDGDTATSDFGVTVDGTGIHDSGEFGDPPTTTADAFVFG